MSGTQRAALERAVLDGLAHAARRVPAYAHFLRPRGIDPSRVRTLADFAELPLTDKDNYLRAYPLAQLCVDGDLSAAHSLCVTTGSTGEPVAIPVTARQEQGIVAGLDSLLCEHFDVRRRSTLVLVTFALGTTSAGMLASGACKVIARREHTPMCVLTPGFDADEALRMVQRFASSFTQLIVLGYPLFVDELLARGADEGVDWAALGTKVITAGEGISELWRDRVLERIGSNDPCDAPSLFGTAEAGVVARETPRTIALRRRLREDPELSRRVFGEPGLEPMVFCHDPRARYFEAVAGELVVSASSLGAPLIRYRLHDRGGILERASLPDAFAGEPGASLLYLHGRSDAALVCGANVYVDHVAAALAAPELARSNTGRFKMKVRETNSGPRLRVRVELEAREAPSEALQRRYARVVLERLRELNREFCLVHRLRGEAAAPELELCRPGTPGMELGARGKWAFLEL